MPILVRVFFLISICLGLTSSCSNQPKSILSLQSGLTPTDPEEVTTYIVTAGGDTNHKGIGFYTTEGVLVHEYDFRREGLSPRSLIPWTNESVLVAGDEFDAIYVLDLQGNRSIFHGSASFDGAIRFMTYHSANEIVYVVESNNIEAINTSGARVSNRVIPQTIGGCTLNAPQGMVVDAEGRLLVINSGGNDQLLIYDVSTIPATCTSATNIGNDPRGMILHSDGFLYFVTQANDRVYRANPDGTNLQIVWNTNTSIIDNPSAIVELPNGNLLISSTTNDTIEQITTAGVRVGTSPFILDALSLNIMDIVVIGVPND